MPRHRSRSPHWPWLLLVALLWPAHGMAQDARAIQVVIEGVEGALRDTLRNDLSLSHLENDRYPAQTEFLFRRGKQELSNSLRAHGYYQAQVTSSLERDANTALARFHIQTGEPVYIREVSIQIQGSGANELAWQRYRQFELPLREGQRLFHADYLKTITDLLNIATNHGYLDARYLQRRFEVSPERGEASIDIVLDTGDPYLFGPLSFDEHSQIEQALLHRFVEFSQGDRFSNAALAELQQTLISTRYFGMVRYDPRFDEREGREIPISVYLEDNLPHRYRVGLGAGTDTGPRLLLGFENRLVNERGHRYEFDSVLGQSAQSGLFNYSIPGRLPARQRWNLRAGMESSQSDFLRRTRTTLMPEYSHLTRNNWLLGPYLSLEQETYQYEGQQQFTSQLLVSGITLQKRVLNATAYPTSGYRHNLALRMTRRELLSDSEFLQLEAATKWVTSPLEGWRLIARGKLATTLSDDLEEIPASYRYLLGGETLRGFTFESVGVRGEQGGLTGAKHMALASVETDYRFGRWLGLAAFTDAGQVFESGVNTSLKVGSGIGLRAFTPVGQIRLDMAWAVSEPNNPWRLHFSLGLDL